jgi:hypothetical protein
MLSGGPIAIGRSGCITQGKDCLGCVLLIHCGFFMWPFAVAGLAFHNVEIFGLHNNWCANITPLARVCTQCVKDARLTPGCMVGGMACRAQSASGADCESVVLVLLQPLIDRVHKLVDTSLYPCNKTFPLNIHIYLKQMPQYILHCIMARCQSAMLP